MADFKRADLRNKQPAHHRRGLIKSGLVLGLGGLLAPWPSAVRAARVTEVSTPASGLQIERRDSDCVFEGRPCWISGDAARQLGVQVTDPRFYRYVGSQFHLDELFFGAGWADGPVWLPEEQALVFSDTRENLLYRWSAAHGPQRLRSPAGQPQGNAVDGAGRLLTAEQARHGISRTEAAGRSAMLVERFAGRRFNGPNDLAVRSDGTIWLTDSACGACSPAKGGQASSEMAGSYVYCFDPATGQISIATFEMFRPNGIAFSPDEKYLYLSESSSAEFGEQGLSQLVLFDVEGTRLSNRRVLAEVTPAHADGLAVRPNGIIFCSSGNGLVTFLPDGTELGRLVLGKPASNCVFADEKTLFITALNSVYRLKLGGTRVRAPVPG